MTKTTSDKLIRKYGLDSKCRVWYHNQKGFVAYDSMRNVNWKECVRITVLFDAPKIYYKNGEACKRDGAAYTL